KRLLVVIWDKSSKNLLRFHGRQEECAIVVSNESLFSRIKDVIAQHENYLKNPADIEYVDQTLNAAGNDLLGGYLIRYFELKGLFSDKEVLALSKLLNNPNVYEV